MKRERKLKYSLNLREKLIEFIMMGRKNRDWLLLIFLGTVGFLVWFFSLRLLYPTCLTFSDAAKFADAATQMVQGNGFTAKFGFFHSNFVFAPEASQPIVPGFGILNAISLFIFFKLLGISDFAVVFTSGFFFIASGLLVYFLAKKIFDEKIAVFSSLAFVFTQPFLDYASIGAGEPLFIFLFLASCLLFVQEKKYLVFASAVVASLLLLTRPQAPIYIVGSAFFVYLCSLKDKDRRLFTWLGVFALSLVFLFILSKATGQKFIHFETVSSLFFERATVSQNMTIRGKAYVSYPSLFLSFKPLVVKIFYNLYNFYKLLPSFVSSYLVALYLLSLARWDRKRKANALQLAGFLILSLSFIASSATIPFMRYIHPVAPVVIIFSVEMLFWIANKVISSQWSVIRKRLPITNHQSLVAVLSIILILFFVVGQTLGKIFLDSRYLRTQTNQGKPPVYVKLAQILRENTEPDDLIITNLDTWGTWYGERKTIWFPYEPSQLIPPEGKNLAVDAIFLTTYKINDESSFMGENWREIFYKPENLQDPFLAKNFVFKEKFEVKSNQTYEKEGAEAILLVRK